MISYYLGKDYSGSVLVEITDQAGHKKIDTLENTAGIHRYRWNLQFDPKPFTPEQRKTIEDLLTDLQKQYSFSGIRRADAAFKRAKTPLEQYKAIGILTNGYLSFQLGDEYRIPTAGSGTYFVKMKAGDKEFKRTIRVREDPLLGTK